MKESLGVKTENIKDENNKKAAKAAFFNPFYLQA